MRLHKQARAVLVKPTTAVAVAQFYKIQGTVVFIGPVVVFDAAYGDIYKNDTAGAKHGRHAPVRQPDVSITVMGIAIGQHAFETAPLFDHAGEQFSTLWIERGIEAQWSFQRYGGSGKMCMRGMKGATIWETILDGNIIPSENLERIQVVDDRESIKFVEAGNDAAVFDISQTADMKNQLRAAAARRQFKACAFYIAIG